MMPLFMDRHDIPGLTAMDVAEGHKQDLKIQHKFNCRALTYWFDEDRGTAFCLIEAPDKKAVEALHNNSHGLVPNHVNEVDPGLVEAFLGRIEDPDISKTSDTDPLQHIDSAFRTVLVTDIKNEVLIKSNHGIDTALKFINAHNESVRQILKKHGGRSVTYAGNGIAASFTSVSQSYKCALEIQQKSKTSQLSPVEIYTAASLHAGEPITNKKDFFGEVMKLAKRLCRIAGSNQILLSSSVRDQCRKKGLDIESKNDVVKILHPKEETFLTRLMDVTDKIWSNETLTVAYFAKKTGLSKSQLYRNITSLTGRSPKEFIKEIRLKKAIRLIEKQQGNIAQIAYETGFNNPSYFSKCFKKRFGILPSDYKNAVT